MIIRDFDGSESGGFDPRNYRPIGIDYVNSRSTAGLETIFSVTGEGFIDLVGFGISGWQGTGYVQIIIDDVTYTFNFTITSGDLVTYGGMAIGLASGNVITSSDSGQRVPSATGSAGNSALCSSVLFNPSVTSYGALMAVSPLSVFFNTSVVVKAYYNSNGKLTVRGGLLI